jgi:hypothetical protein
MRKPIHNWANTSLLSKLLNVDAWNIFLDIMRPNADLGRITEPCMQMIFKQSYDFFCHVQENFCVQDLRRESIMYVVDVNLVISLTGTREPDIGLLGLSSESQAFPHTPCRGIITPVGYIAYAPLILSYLIMIHHLM